LYFFLFVNTVSATTITPVRQTIVLDPGASQVVQVELMNDSDDTVAYIPEVDAFSLNQDNGRAVFGARDIALLWTQANRDSVLVAPGQTILISFTVTIPEDAEPGSHYLGLFAKQAPVDGTIGVGSRVGSLLFLHVAGEYSEDVTRELFFSDNTFVWGGPVTLNLILKNNGTIHAVPNGTIILRTPNGRLVAQQKIGDDNRKILPQGRWESKHVFSGLDWRDSGRLEAVLSLQYGISNQREILDRITLWYLPIGFSFFVLAGLILLFVTLLYLKRRHKKKIKDHKFIE
jgi:hypothetical protein